ncbi:MAG TPA: MarR family transcriptional regulator [Flavobacteriales bacterium]|nr:MarR family transcriptional regulator [Flavobacteriales bacterium]HNK40141.1 MarR family transcriptional regulator [Flavobacteriales bacterium]HNK85512.1 MarR family transcriptional regulator [Flavobacteriales bacterium]HNO04132.1 MarR family transcriptional regulator [Flavobacteriales bacterium]
MRYIGLMAVPKSPFHTCLFYTASALSRQLARLADEQFLAFDLSPSQGFILLTLRRAPGISVSDLASELFLDQSTVTKTLDKMIMKGLVQREAIGRNVRVFLTGKGEEREADAKAAWKKLRLTYTRVLGAGAVEQLCQDLVRSKGRLDGEED